MAAPAPAASGTWGGASRVASVLRWHEKGEISGRAHTELLLEGARLKPGMRVLDLACGAGTPALDEAHRVGTRGHVIAIDPAADLLALGRKFAKEQCLAQLEFRLGDATQLRFESTTFDRVTSRFGPMYFPDLGLAISESYRVLRPAGTLAWLVWGPFDQPFFRSTIQVVMRRVGVSEPPEEALRPFCFGAGGILARALTEGGFVDVRETAHELFWSWPGPPEEVTEYWLEGAPPFRSLLDRLTPEARSEAAVEITESLRQYYSKGSVRVPEHVILATGTRPVPVVRARKSVPPPKRSRPSPRPKPRSGRTRPL